MTGADPAATLTSPEGLEGSALRIAASSSTIATHRDGERPFADDALHDNRRRHALDARQRRQCFITELLVGGNVGGDDAEEVVGFSEEAAPRDTPLRPLPSRS